MQRQPLTSKAIVSAGYDPQAQTLDIEFRNGRVYRYFGVSQGTYDFLLRARSKGAYVNRMIDGRYRHQDITPAPPAQDLLSALQASLGPDGREND